VVTEKEMVSGTVSRRLAPISKRGVGWSQWLFCLSEARDAGSLSPVTPTATTASLRLRGRSRQAEREPRGSFWFMSFFGLFGSFGFPIRQPNERDKLNKPNKRNEPVWSLPTATAFGLKVDEPLHVISWSVLRNDLLSAVQGSVWRVAQWDLIRSQ
jgi:hypothetical protein